jgi:hypothetical protein
LPDDLDIPTCPELASEPGDELMWDFLRQCLKECLVNHAECRRAQQITWYPKRLLEIEKGAELNSNLRLINTIDHAPSGPYIALSHCWGESQPVRSLTSNIAAFQECIDNKSLTAVFQDCVATAKKFGIDYVWIDSLCIVQDDRADLDEQIQQMHRIYENAILVIAADSSEDGSVPFLGPKAPSKRHSSRAHEVELSLAHENLSPIRARRYPSGRPDLTEVHGPLTYRAWAWQERALATRMIHFTQEQAIWECLQARGSEFMGALEDRHDAMRMRMRDTEYLDNTWQKAVHEYGEKALTFATDRLPALSGVAARFQSLFKTQYCAGLWRDRMVLDLAWENDVTLSVLLDAMPPALDNSVPSWSWASTSGSAYWGTERHYNEVIVQYSVVDVDCVPKTDNLLGQVLPRSTVQIEGHFVPAILATSERGFAVVNISEHPPQMVTEDCLLVETTVTLEGIVARTLRRALPHEKFVPTEEEERGPILKRLVSGFVICFLLFSGNYSESETESAVIMILAPTGEQLDTMQRIGIGRGGLDVLSKVENSTPRPETWDRWRELFSEARRGRFTIV